MASITNADTANAARNYAGAKVRRFPVGGILFDTIATALSVWFLLGMFLDGWAHNHGKVDNTFFTPWHAVLYSSVLVVAIFLVVVQFANMRRGFTWAYSLPRGYGISRVGVLVFLSGGLFDFAWHSWFGFEANVEALLSPAHLLLATGAFLFLTGPLRAAWMRPRDERKDGWLNLLPVVVSLCGLLSLMTFFTQYAHPFANARTIALSRFQVSGDSDFFDVSGIASVLFYAALSMGVLFFGMRRWKLPFGSLALILGANTLLMFWMRYNTSPAHLTGLIAGVAGGIYAEALYRVLQPSTGRLIPLRLFAFSVPFLTFLTLFLLLLSQYRIAWSINMWLGVTFLSGVAGLFLSYVVFPSPMVAAPDTER